MEAVKRSILPEKVGPTDMSVAHLMLDRWVFGEPQNLSQQSPGQSDP